MTGSTLLESVWPLWSMTFTLNVIVVHSFKGDFYILIVTLQVLWCKTLEKHLFWFCSINAAWDSAPCTGGSLAMASYSYQNISTNSLNTSYALSLCIDRWNFKKLTMSDMADDMNRTCFVNPILIAIDRSQAGCQW